MIAILLLLGAVLLASGGLTVLLLWGATHPAGNLKAALKARWYRLFQDPDSKSSTGKVSDPVVEAFEENGDTFGFQRASWFIPGNHRLDCWEKCCIDIRVLEFDWHAREYEMGTKR